MAQNSTHMGRQLKTEGWADQVRNALAYTDMSVDLVDDVKVDLDSMHSRLLKMSRNRWLLEATDETKLRTFIQIYDMENPRVSLF